MICDGYPDSPEQPREIAHARRRPKVPNNAYPYEKERPFFWRTGAAFADLNGDGLMDLVTHDGHTRKATLFVQYRDSAGKLRLKKDRAARSSPTDGRSTIRSSGAANTGPSRSAASIGTATG